MRLLLLLASLSAAPDPVELDELPAEVPRRALAPPLATAKPLPVAELDLAAPLPDGGLGLRGERLTLDPVLQHELTDLLKSYQTPWAAVVVLEPGSGRVLAMAEHSETEPALRSLCTRALFPAASVFKIVTAAALLEAGVSPGELSCYHGGKRKVSEELLQDTAADGRCVTLEEALGLSANVIFAKLTARYLDPRRLARAAKAFRFNSPLLFPLAADVSLAAIPSETAELASTGAGFGDVYMSPLHAAALVSVVANHGEWRWPVLFEKDVGSRPAEPAIDPARAQALEDMLASTVQQGTARHFFSQPQYRFDAVGKTGSLADKSPVFRDYSWFAGFAPRSHPRVAVAAVVVNDPAWRIRATWLAAEALRLALSKRHEPKESARLDDTVKASVNH